MDAVLSTHAGAAPLLDLYETGGAAPSSSTSAPSPRTASGVLDDLLGEGELIRHDSDKLARAVLALAPLRHDPATDPVVVATRAALRERRTP